MTKLGPAAFFLLFAAVCVAAQPAAPGKNELSVWGGYSPDSSTAIPALGRTLNTKFGIVSFRYSRRFNNSGVVNLKYTADLTPAAVVIYPDALAGRRRTAYGFGAAPLGIQANLRPRKKLQPFVGLSGGMLYFNKRIPNSLGTRFMFTADIGAGIEFKMNNGRSLTAGYKYFHISNAGRGAVNPGMDNNLFYLGYTFFSK